MTSYPPSGPSGPRAARKVPLDDSDLMRLDRQSRVGRRRKGGGIILAAVLIVVVVVVLAGVWFYFLRPGEENTPEEAFLDMIDAFNRKDAEDVIRSTVITFASQTVRDLEIANLEMYWAAGGQSTITITSMAVVTRDMMGPSVIEPLDETVAYVESAYHIDVDDSCGMTFTGIVTTSDGSHDVDNAMPMVRVDSMWYVAYSPFF